MILRVSLLQMNIALGNVSTNEEKARTMLKKAMEQKPQVLILPELWNTGYDTEHLLSLSQKEKGTSLSLLKKMARDNSVTIVGGSIPENREEKCYNMMPLINNRGAITLKYRKTHLFPLGIKEEQYFESGDQWGIGAIGDITVGLMLCYDLRFPEFCRNLVLRGASIIFVAAEWPSSRLSHWRTLLQSRAIENQIYIVAVNRVGEDRLWEYPGHSMVIDPLGTILAEGSEKEEILTADLDLSLIEKTRKQIPALSQRLNILDEIDNNYL